jgi:hypothetical protein
MSLWAEREEWTLQAKTPSTARKLQSDKNSGNVTEIVRYDRDWICKTAQGLKTKRKTERLILTNNLTKRKSVSKWHKNLEAGNKWNVLRSFKPESESWWRLVGGGVQVWRLMGIFGS